MVVGEGSSQDRADKSPFTGFPCQRYRVDEISKSNLSIIERLSAKDLEETATPPIGDNCLTSPGKCSIKTF